MSGYVYIIGTSVFGWYKIGKSITPEVRIANLGILLPFKIKVIGVWKAENHHLMERALHEIYAANKINGEWFEFSKPDIIKVFNYIPAETRIYPLDGTDHELARFSNVYEDTKKSGKVIGVRVQKLRGDFTPEEREERRIASMARQKERKEIQASLKLQTEML